MKSNLLPLGAAMLALGLSALPAQAQNVKPPKAQLWMDISTGGMAGMPDMDSGIGRPQISGDDGCGSGFHGRPFAAAR